MVIFWKETRRKCNEYKHEISELKSNKYCLNERNHEYKKNISRRALWTVFEIKIILNDYQIIFERVIQLKTCLFTK